METEIKKSIRQASNANALVLLIFYGIVFAGSALIQILLKQFIREDSEYFTALYQLIAFLFQYVVTVPILLVIFRAVLGKKIGWKLKDSYHKPQATGGQLVRWCLIALGLVYVSAYISNFATMIFQAITKIELNTISMTAETNWIGYMGNLLAFAILAPLFEEMLFRATLFRNTERFGGWFAAIITGIFFGLWHINHSQILYAAALGVVAAFLTAKTRSVFPAMTVHFVMNLIGAVQSIALSGLDLNALNADIITEHLGQFAVIGCMTLLMIGLMITGIVLLILEICNHRDTFRLENRCLELKNGQKVLTYLTAPVTLLTLLVLIALTVYNAMPV